LVFLVSKYTIWQPWKRALKGDNLLQSCSIMIRPLKSLDGPSNEKNEKQVKNRNARLFLVQNTKTGINIPNCHKIFPMAVKQTKWS
jgi:hypothetical protein